jgi:hypothetical protein
MYNQLIQLVVKQLSQRFKRWEKDTIALQQKQFKSLINGGKHTQFGLQHNFSGIKSYADFCQNVPIRDYSYFEPFVNRIIKGEKDVLWPGKPIYFAKTSGTTSGAKYIPITKESMPNHINSARNALLMYIYKTGKTQFINGKYIFISGSPELDKVGGILSGRLSGIVNHHVPWYVKINQLPSYATNCIDDWERKLDAVVNETIAQKMTLISGIPPWVEMYFERILRVSGRETIGEAFPHFSLYVHGGVNFKPYEQRFRQLIGRDIDFQETFPASEGFFAFQDEFPSQGLLLIPDSGIFYEFVPADRFDEPNPPRVPLEGVEVGVNYALVVSTNAGLWAYSIGDTVRFVSKNPYRLVVTGRLKHFTSAFGEHVIAEEVETALDEVCNRFGAQISEFTVAPLINNPDGAPCHEWFVEFSKAPQDMALFQISLDEAMQQRNPYYKDLVKGKILQPLILQSLPKGAFVRYMKSVGKLGGQNKVPHLKNDRSIADELTKYL